MTVGLQKRREDHYRWKGGQMLTHHGYVYSLNPDHKFSNNKGYVMEHRIVWERFNKASLLPWGIVHHKNGNKKDNRIENLQGMMNSKHSSLHNRIEMSSRRCMKCGSSKTRFKQKRGYFEWYKLENGFECFNCHQREYRRKKGIGNRIM